MSLVSRNPSNPTVDPPPRGSRSDFNQPPKRDPYCMRIHTKRDRISRIGITISGGPNPAEIVDLVDLAESLGYESAWVTEGHGGDQFAILAACAARTSRILPGTSISSVFVRTAPTIAMAASRAVRGCPLLPSGRGARTRGPIRSRYGDCCLPHARASCAAYR
jgi:hypothetical protein